MRLRSCDCPPSPGYLARWWPAGARARSPINPDRWWPAGLSAQRYQQTFSQPSAQSTSKRTSTQPAASPSSLCTSSGSSQSATCAPSPTQPTTRSSSMCASSPSSGPSPTASVPTSSRTSSRIGPYSGELGARSFYHLAQTIKAGRPHTPQGRLPGLPHDLDARGDRLALATWTPPPPTSPASSSSSSPPPTGSRELESNIDASQFFEIGREIWEKSNMQKTAQKQPPSSHISRGMCSECEGPREWLPKLNWEVECDECDSVISAGFFCEQCRAFSCHQCS